MKLKALRAHYVEDRLQAVGAVYEVADALGRQLIAANKAEVHVEAQKAKPEAKAEAKPKAEPRLTTMTTQSAPALVPGAPSAKEQ